METLAPIHWPDCPLLFPDSMLHMRPGLLADTLDGVVTRELSLGRRVVLVYGDCCARMAELEGRPGVARTRGNNCCELLLGHDAYLRRARGGAFFLLPEWIGRWREVFEKELGLTRENARDLMGDMHRTLVYLDTGIMPVPVVDMADCAEYCGLPWEVLPVSLEHLRDVVGDALCRLPDKELSG
jgi:hypothetical protein